MLRGTFFIWYTWNELGAFFRFFLLDFFYEPGPELSLHPSGLSMRAGYLEEGHDVGHNFLGGDESGDGGDASQTVLTGALAHQLIHLQFNNVNRVKLCPWIT